MWGVAGFKLRRLPDWAAAQALWRRAFGVKNNRELPCQGRFFIRKQRGVVVSMCRVDEGELWDVCTHEDWQSQGHATAVCQSAIQWARERDITLLAVTDNPRLGRWYTWMGCTPSVYV